MAEGERQWEDLLFVYLGVLANTGHLPHEKKPHGFSNGLIYSASDFQNAHLCELSAAQQ